MGSGSGDNSIKKWDIKTGALMATLEGHADEVTCLAISEKEGAIFSGSGDKTIKAWESRRGSHLWTEQSALIVVQFIPSAESGNSRRSEQAERILNAQPDDLARQNVFAMVFQGSLPTAAGLQ